MLFAVENVRLGDLHVVGLNQHDLDAILHVLYGDQAVLDLGAEVGGDAQGEHVQNFPAIGRVGGVERRFDGVLDFVQVKLDD